MKLFKKYGFYTFTGMLFLLSVLFIFIYNDYIKVTQERIIVDKYKKTAKDMRSEIANLLLIKEKATMGIALSLASNGDLKRYILKEYVPKKYYEALIQRYKKHTLYQNIWIQVLDKKGISLYRSWTQDKGDKLLKLRKEIAAVKKEQSVQYAVSVGRYDLSLKAMVPVFNKGKFIGLVEVISHFNSIAKNLKNEEIDSVVLAEKTSSKHLKHPFTKMFVDGYYIANFDAPKKLRDILLKYKVENFFNKEYVIKDGYFIVDYSLKDITGKTIGHYLAFKKLDAIQSKDLAHFQFQWIVFTLLFLMAVAGVINIVMYYKMRRQKIYYKNIIDASHNIILVNDKKSIVDVNRTFFEYFPQYKTLDAFRKENNCICNFFVQEEGYLDKGSKAYNWLDVVLSSPEENHKVKMNIDGKIYYFLVNAALISEDQEHYSVIFSDITKEENYKRELEKLTITDPLTQIGNRRFYNVKIEETLHMTERYKFALSVIIFDIDFFKKVNDAYGHKTGDNVLVECVEIVQDAIRDVDIFCRIGGEEFVIIVPLTDLAATVKMAEKIRKRVEQKSTIVPITISLGVAEHVVGEDADNLLNRADKALYKAKENGRNRVVFT